MALCESSTSANNSTTALVRLTASSGMSHLSSVDVTGRGKALAGLFHPGATPMSTTALAAVSTLPGFPVCRCCEEVLVSVCLVVIRSVAVAAAVSVVRSSAVDSLRKVTAGASGGIRATVGTVTRGRC